MNAGKNLTTGQIDYHKHREVGEIKHRGQPIHKRLWRMTTVSGYPALM